MSIYSQGRGVQPAPWNVHRAGVAPEWRHLWDMKFCVPFLGGYAHDYAPGAPNGGRPIVDQPSEGYAVTSMGYAAQWDQPTEGTADECTFPGKTLTFDGATLILGLRQTADETVNNCWLLGNAETGTGSLTTLYTSGTGSPFVMRMSNVTNSNALDLTALVGQDLVVVGFRRPGIRCNVRVYEMGTRELLLESSSPDNAATGTDVTDVSKECVIGAPNNNRSARSLTGFIFGGYVWNRWIGFEAVEQVAQDFYGLVRPDFRVIGKAPAVVAEYIPLDLAHRPHHQPILAH